MPADEYNNHGVNIAMSNPQWNYVRFTIVNCSMSNLHFGFIAVGGVAASLVLGQRAIFALGEHVRSRLNGLYIALFFVGGALGSGLGTWMFSHYGWNAALLTGMAFPAVGLACWLAELAGRRVPASKSM